MDRPAGSVSHERCRRGRRGSSLKIPRSIDREGVRRLRDQGAQVVEVLPRAEYDWKHLAGAINLPLKELERMKSRGFEASFITDSDGRLWGLVGRADLERALGEDRP